MQCHLFARFAVLRPLLYVVASLDCCSSVVLLALVVLVVVSDTAHVFFCIVAVVACRAFLAVFCTEALIAFCKVPDVSYFPFVTSIPPVVSNIVVVG